MKLPCVSAPLSVAERLMRLYRHCSVFSSPALSAPPYSRAHRAYATPFQPRPLLFAHRHAVHLSTATSAPSITSIAADDPSPPSHSSASLPPPHAHLSTPRSPPRDRILLHGLVFHAHHGVYAEERALGQRFEVDAELRLSLTKAAMTGDLEETVDYGRVYRQLKREVEGTQCRLLEEVAWQVMAVVMGAGEGRVEEAVVRVKKPQVAVKGVVDYLGVELSRTRKEWEDDRRRVHTRKRPKDITQLTVE